jgi:hypothetical protein
MRPFRATMPDNFKLSIIGKLDPKQNLFQNVFFWRHCGSLNQSFPPLPSSWHPVVS